MKKISILGSLLAVSMLAIGGTAAHAVAPTGTQTVKVSPAVTGKPIKKIFLAGTVDVIPGMAMQPIPKELKITLPKAKIDKRAIKGTDTVKKVEEAGRCTKSKYRLGTLKVVARAVPLLIDTLNTSGEICLVKTNSGSVFSVVLAVVYDPLGIRLAVPAEVKLVSGAPTIIVDSSILFQLVAGQSVAIQSLSANINRNPKRKIGKGKKRRTVYLMNTPSKCKNKVWKASQVTTFFDADPLVTETTAKCKQAKKKKKK